MTKWCTQVISSGSHIKKNSNKRCVFFEGGGGGVQGEIDLEKLGLIRVRLFVRKDWATRRYQFFTSWNGDTKILRRVYVIAWSTFFPSLHSALVYLTFLQRYIIVKLFTLIVWKGTMVGGLGGRGMRKKSPNPLEKVPQPPRKSAPTVSKKCPNPLEKAPQHTRTRKLIYIKFTARYLRLMIRTISGREKGGKTEKKRGPRGWIKEKVRRTFFSIDDTRNSKKPQSRGKHV